MPTRSNVYMSWTGVTVTPSGGSTMAISEVTDVQVHDKDHIEPWQADGHKYATRMIAASGERGITITGGDVGKLASIPKNVPCTVVAILNDAVNGVGTGAVTVTLVNAIRGEVPSSGKTSKFAGGSVSFMAFSSDGTADPLSYAAAT